jgi:hypothetical protein
MKQALILGCSHAAGSEISSDYQYNYSHSFPIHIAKRLGSQPRNHAIPGGSNDAMFRIFERELENLDCNDLVIVCWTGCNRSEIYHAADQQWLPLNAGQQGWLKTIDNDIVLEGIPRLVEGRSFYETISNLDNYQQYVKSWVTYGVCDAASRTNKIKNIISLNFLASNKNVKVINIDSFDPVHDCPILKQFDWVDLIFLDWCLDQKFQHTESLHFYEDAHLAFSACVIESRR